MHHLSRLFAAILLASCASQSVATPASTSRTAAGQGSQSSASKDATSQLLTYIDKAWFDLVRDLNDLPTAARDPKFREQTRWPIYIPAKENIAVLKPRLQSLLTELKANDVYVEVLPTNYASIKNHGLLYLPHPYVVPGGRFNEMYGWDSYFILTGLLESGKAEHIKLAKNMTDNALYQVQYYGQVLNANRTYFLQRSQPPFLSRMVLEVFEKSRDEAWLKQALPLLEKYYALWIKPPKFTAKTGLSRYYAGGSGPAPEVLADEVDDKGLSHYDRVKAAFRRGEGREYAKGRFYRAEDDSLTKEYFVADRTMRESGFDPSERFGPFNLGVVDHNPVCLNTLLYVMERDIAWIYSHIGNAAASKQWERRGDKRKQAIQKTMWDEEQGLFLDYNFVTGVRRNYPFLTSYWPMWAGIATKNQAKQLVTHLDTFAAPGGLMTSARRTGNQWDAPFTWGNLQQMVVLGLRRYGYNAEASKIAQAFVSVVSKEFREHGAIFEKYDAVAMESSVAHGIRFGYSKNQTGFGWTNSAILILLDSSAGKPPTKAADALSMPAWEENLAANH